MATAAKAATFETLAVTPEEHSREKMRPRDHRCCCSAANVAQDFLRIDVEMTMAHPLLLIRTTGASLMCPLCTTSAALTAAAATSTATAFATLGVDLTRLFLAPWQSLKAWVLRIYDQIGNGSSR
jgi:hypothetical protein